MTNQNLAGTQDLALGSFEVDKVQAFLPFAGGDAKVSFFGGQVGGIDRLTQSVLNHDLTVLTTGAYIQNFFAGVGVNRQQVVALGQISHGGGVEAVAQFDFNTFVGFFGTVGLHKGQEIQVIPHEGGRQGVAGVDGGAL